MSVRSVGRIILDAVGFNKVCVWCRGDQLTVHELFIGLLCISLTTADLAWHEMRLVDDYGFWSKELRRKW